MTDERGPGAGNRARVSPRLAAMGRDPRLRRNPAQLATDADITAPLARVGDQRQLTLLGAPYFRVDESTNEWTLALEAPIRVRDDQIGLSFGRGLRLDRAKALELRRMVAVADSTGAPTLAGLQAKINELLAAARGGDHMES